MAKTSVALFGGSTYEQVSDERRKAEDSILTNVSIGVRAIVISGIRLSSVLTVSR